MNALQIALLLAIAAVVVWVLYHTVKAEDEADRYHPDMQHHGERDAQTDADLALVRQERRFREAETRGLGANTKTPAYRPAVSGPRDDSDNLLTFFRGQQS